MKPFKILLPIILMCAMVGAQENEVLKKIVKAGLLTQKQTKYYKNYLEKTEEKNNAIYVTSIFQAKYKDRIGHFHSAFANTVLDDSNGTEAQKQEATKNLLLEIEKLKSTELISAKLYNAYKQRIMAGEFYWDLTFYMALSEAALYEAWMAPEKLEPYAKRLIDLGVVTDKKEMLIADIKAGKIETPLGFIPYFAKAVVINTDEYGNKPEEFVEAIHKKIASILPELAFSDFSFRITQPVTNAPHHYEPSNLEVTLTNNGTVYKYKSFYSINYTQNHDLGIPQIYEIFNKILTDKKSAYRLTQPQTYAINDTQKSFAIIALTEKQNEEMNKYVADYVISGYEKYNQPTTAEINATIATYKNIGIFTHLTDKQIDAAKENIAKNTINNLTDLLNFFPDVVWSFDLEGADTETPYAMLVTEYAKLTHGELKPEKINDDFNSAKKYATLSFNANGKHFKTKIKKENNWINTDIFAFMNTAAQQIGLKGTFYELTSGYDFTGIIYLLPKQYKTLLENNIIKVQKE